MPPFTMHAPQHACPLHHAHPLCHTYPPPREQIHRCKNITFPQLHLCAVTRQHSSRMRTAHLLTVHVFCDGHWVSVAVGGGQVGPQGKIPKSHVHWGWGVRVPRSHVRWGILPSDLFNDAFDVIYPSPREQTYTCENITFPKLRLRAVIKNSSGLDRKY